MLNELSVMTQVLILFIVAVNIFSFILYYVDKRRAINHKFRISEKTLLLSSFALGGIGAWLGMTVFRHKTQHKLFIYSLPVAAILTAIILVLLVMPVFS